MRDKFLSVAVLAALLVPAHLSYAGPYSDELARCIVDATTVSDRTAFVKWLFSAASLHPAVKSISDVSAEQLEAANRQTAELVMRLLTQSCTDKAEKAIRYEGSSAMETAFSTLGQVAGREMFSSPEVSAGMAGVARYLDEEKLKAAFTKK